MVKGAGASKCRDLLADPLEADASPVPLVERGHGGNVGELAAGRRV